MQNDSSHLEIPLGFGMALAQRPGAMNHFATLSRQDQEQILAQAHAVQSKEEMQRYVDSLDINRP